MGYQVGNQCFSTQLQAENHYFSLIVPSIASDGRLIKPEYNGQQWQLNGITISANLPECDPAQNMKDGMTLGWMVVGIIAAMYVFTVVKKLIR